MTLKFKFRRIGERREMKRDIRQLRADLYIFANDPVKTRELEFKLRRAIENFDWLESPRLLRSATRLGIELPADKSEWWYSRNIGDPLDIARFENVLTAKGRRGARKLIRDEHFRLIKTRAELLLPILALVVAILALVRK